MITVMGATGNTGSLIARSLLEAGLPVRAIARSRAKLEVLEKAGAEVRVGDLADERFLTAALEGSAAAYTLLPTDRTSADYRAAQDRQGIAIVAALRACGVPHVVALSSVGADRTDAPGVIGGLAAQEVRLRSLDLKGLLLLRPVSFYENFYDSLPLVGSEGIIADGLAADVSQPMVSVRDIASAAAEALATRSWTGLHIREIVGPRELTPREATRILGGRIGKELAYVPLENDALLDALVGAGLSPSFANEYLAMTRSMNERRLLPQSGGADERRGTPFEAFAEDFAAALSEQVAL